MGYILSLCQRQKKRGAGRRMKRRRVKGHIMEGRRKEGKEREITLI